jgi:para-aminobenzoate synthetase
VAGAEDMLTLLIDNYDSFTYNLFQLLAEVNGVEPTVVRNDEASWEELSGLGFDNVVLSPGPGRPERARDFGVCAEAIRRCEAPLLGVCLGHQGLGWVHGGQVAAAPEPLHGRVRAVEHAGAPLFAGIPGRFEATRYHSLCLARPLPDALEEIAWGEDGTVMAVAHRARPQWGVQFHPESIATEHGMQLLANFRDLSRAVLAVTGSEPLRRPGWVDFQSDSDKKSTHSTALPALELKARRVGRAVDPERAFVALYGESSSAFWLDSSRPGPGARFSFIGDASGPLGAMVLYDVDAGEITVEHGGEDSCGGDSGQGDLGTAAGPGEVEVRTESIFEYLEREQRRLPQPPADLPFDFACGFAGYLGYEVKADCGSANAHASPLPDAAFVFADRLIAFDHESNHTYLLCLTQPGEESAAEIWLSATESRLATLAGSASLGEIGEDSMEPPRCCDSESSPISPHLARSHDRYLDDIATCLDLLRQGESYELCLTNSIAAEVEADPLSLYIELRRVNPAPFASYLRFGERAVLSSSPERFLRVDRERGVEAKPIKGTSRRGATAAEDAELAAHLREDEKNRAENLMIVDLLRNDLGRVCEVGSVAVPALMEVESYETVHQLVSTVRGRLREGLSAPACIRACFPPGSMTGAPKLRTMEILERLEGQARGVYSGAIGYFGLGGGCDLSVAIRAIVLDGDRATIGAGGAIVLQSDPEAEYGEMLLKAAAPLRAIDPGADPAAISLADPRPAAASSAPPASAHDLTS